MGKVTGFLEYPRQGPSYRPVPVRLRDWREVYEAQGDDAVAQQGARCMDCGIPFCMQGCPLGNPIPSFNDDVYRSKWDHAAEQLFSTNNFPEFTGRLCPAPCESACVLGIGDSPVTIERIEYEVAEHAFTLGYGVASTPAARTGHRVAVVGSGPAGLAAAAQLASVGHEVDVTLTDFAADARAATPSQAAEMCVPDARARAAALAHNEQRLRRAMHARVTESRVALGELQRTLGDPRLAIASFQQTLDDRTARLEASARHVVARRREALAAAQHRLAFVHPRAVITREKTAFVRLGDRLAAVARASLEKRTASLANAGARLDALSPLKVLSRGYAIAQTDDGRAVRSAADLRPGARLQVRVERARIEADVVAVTPVAPGEPE